MTDLVLPLELPLGVKPDTLPGFMVIVWCGLRPATTLDLTDESSPGKKKESAILDFL